MKPTSLEARVAAATGAAAAVQRERIQSVWSGYGELVRLDLRDGPTASVVVKHVQPPQLQGRSHARKLRSYAVERTWYGAWSARCGQAAPVAPCFHAEHAGNTWLFVLGDLDSGGYRVRTRSPSQDQLDSCLRWLAAFHGRWFGARPEGLWSTGTYWHLATRPDELRAMRLGTLREAAGALDRRLSASPHQTLVHGDAKPANFCWTPDGRAVAAVDFQYVGGGVGVKDVAYLLTGQSRSTAERGLDHYFEALRAALARHHPAVDGAAVEANWRALYPIACADFFRFLAGWSPGWRATANEQALTRRALAAL